ncbi:AraC family transcriptional regulator [Aestuariibacter halophilus]|uniref:AraC family transcriptional regulator n=1 Tax=Fluctibacter halophilus TaxID=226011 RepID=A0ABS8G9N8_9ALTE|nr:AraC family transcriptional regulator [Aestuariibacter halophilus]MCC2616530.1 AraC family transcriptional regulator [Aestuariibacter halophilus]
MRNQLSIRSYSTRPVSHAHDFHQLVLPLRGVINIHVGEFEGRVAPGECVVVRAGQEHRFTAEREARFVVADMDTLPDNLTTSQRVVFAISAALVRYLTFVQTQLQHQLHPQLEQSMYQTFFWLLSEQALRPKVDDRINGVLAHIEQHLAEPLRISQLAAVACLSDTQFKKVFKQQTGVTVMQYITALRMDKAQALLTHTDYPLHIIGEQVGYPEPAAFSRAFSRQVGLPPTRFKR